MFFFKSTSRTVYHYQHEQEHHVNINESSISLTVRRKSLVFSCKGFTVIASNGNLAYRVDNYTDRPHQVVLMDGSGDPVFTIYRRKRLGLMSNHWKIYEGEVDKYWDIGKIKSWKKFPFCCVWKSMFSNIMQTKVVLNVLEYVHDGMLSDYKRCTYTVEGSYANRSCKISDESRRVVAEIKKKEALARGVSFGLDVFDLIVKPGFDGRIAMAIVLLLDQMFS